LRLDSGRLQQSMVAHAFANGRQALGLATRRTLGALLCGIHLASAFSPRAPPLLRTSAQTACAAEKVVGRRAFFAVAGSGAAAALLGRPARAPAAAPAGDPAVIEKIKKGIQELARGGSGGASDMRDLLVAVFDDGSVEASSALAGVTQVS